MTPFKLEIIQKGACILRIITTEMRITPNTTDITPNTTGINPSITGINPSITGIHPNTTGINPSITGIHLYLIRFGHCIMHIHETKIGIKECQNNTGEFHIGINVRIFGKILCIIPKP
jgi:hypothetical protein